MSCSQKIKSLRTSAGGATLWRAGDFRSTVRETLAPAGLSQLFSGDRSSAGCLGASCVRAQFRWGSWRSPTPWGGAFRFHGRSRTASSPPAHPSTSRSTLHAPRCTGSSIAALRTKGTRAEKKDASRHRSDAAFDVYDRGLQVVPGRAQTANDPRHIGTSACVRPTYNWP
jgi:hypothetical protein